MDPIGAVELHQALEDVREVAVDNEEPILRVKAVVRGGPRVVDKLARVRRTV